MHFTVFYAFLALFCLDPPCLALDGLGTRPIFERKGLLVTAQTLFGTILDICTHFFSFLWPKMVFMSVNKPFCTISSFLRLNQVSTNSWLVSYLCTETPSSSLIRPRWPGWPWLASPYIRVSLFSTAKTRFSAGVYCRNTVFSGFSLFSTAKTPFSAGFHCENTVSGGFSLFYTGKTWFSDGFRYKNTVSCWFSL